MSGINYLDILTGMGSILSAANITGAAYDLSKNMSTRVQLITQVNPELIAGQASQYPMITYKIDGNSIDISETGHGSAANAKRKTEISIGIMGLVWNDNYSSSETDPADIETHYLMENIEQVLRNDTTLGGKVLWSYPTRIDFYQFLEEESHFRVGLMEYKAVKFY